MGRLCVSAQPLVISAVDVPLRVHNDRQTVLRTDGIAETGNGSAGTEEVAEFMGAVQRGGVPDDVIMDMLFVDMRGHDEGVLAL